MMVVQGKRKGRVADKARNSGSSAVPNRPSLDWIQPQNTCYRKSNSEGILTERQRDTLCVGYNEPMQQCSAPATRTEYP